MEAARAKAWTPLMEVAPPGTPDTPGHPLRLPVSLDKARVEPRRRNGHRIAAIACDEPSALLK
ncbi:hypothetical protein VTH06DRAFT_1828 [Thermothelomyces fergusii]